MVQTRSPPLRLDEVQHLVDVEDRVQQLRDHVSRAVVGHRQVLGEHVLDQRAVDHDALLLAKVLELPRLDVARLVDAFASGFDEGLLVVEPRLLVELLDVGGVRRVHVVHAFLGGLPGYLRRHSQG
jgi:hypothetical protein